MKYLTDIELKALTSIASPDAGHIKIANKDGRLYLKDLTGEYEVVLAETGQTLTYDYDATAAEIQADIDVLRKYIPSNITIQFTNTSKKDLDNAAAVDKGSGLIGIPCTAHGFATSDIIHIDGTTYYDGEHTVDATSTTDEIVITSSYVAETFSGNEVVRIPCSLDAAISINSFYGGRITMQGNTSEYDDNQRHTSQDVVLKQTSSSSAVFDIRNSNVYIKNIRCIAYSGKTAIDNYDSDVSIMYSSVQSAGVGSSSGYAYNDNATGSPAAATTGKVFRCLVEGFKYGILAGDNSKVYSIQNDDTGTKPVYYLYATSNGAIGKRGAQGNGSTADELTSNGGVIR